MGDEVFGKYSVAIVTPFVRFEDNENQPIDMDGLESVIAHIGEERTLLCTSERSGVVGGIIVSGSTGEQHCMTVDERCLLYKNAVMIANRFNIPVAAGVSATTIAAAVQLAKAAVTSGCKGVMLGLPPYCKLCDEEIRSYIMTVKGVVGDLPVLLYNNAVRNGYSPSLALLAEICSTNVIWGIKHAVSPESFIPQATQLLKLCPSARLYTGSDKMTIDLLKATPGGKNSPESLIPLPLFYGVTSIMGNLFPGAVGRIVCCLTSENGERVELGEAQHQRMVPLIDAILLGTSLPVGLKLAMRNKGLRAGFTRRPMGFVSAEKAAEIEKALSGYNADSQNLSF